MKLERNNFGTFVLVNDDMECTEGSFVMMDLRDLIEAYNVIQEQLKEEGILAK